MPTCCTNRETSTVVSWRCASVVIVFGCRLFMLCSGVRIRICCGAHPALLRYSAQTTMCVPFSSRRSVVRLVHSARRLVAPDFELRECLRWIYPGRCHLVKCWLMRRHAGFFFVRCFQISLECCCPCCLVGRVRSNVFVTFKV